MFPSALTIDEIVACARAVQAWSDGFYWRLHAEDVGLGHAAVCDNPHCAVRKNESLLLCRLLPERRLRIVWS